jgi:hypothetical protein
MKVRLKKGGAGATCVQFNRLPTLCLPGEHSIHTHETVEHNIQLGKTPYWQAEEYEEYAGICRSDFNGLMQICNSANEDMLYARHAAIG